MYNRISRTLLPGIVLCGLSVTGCHRGGSGPASEIASLRTELEGTRQKQAETEKALATQKQELDRKALELDTAKKQAADNQVLANQKDTELRAIQGQLTERRDALVFTDISATHQRGFSSIALDRYRQFIIDYPKSPLVADANRAVAELTVAVERDARTRATLIDPKRHDREVLKNFKDGISTVEEIGPLLRQKSVAEVVKLLGPPNRSYRNGSELGYVDKIIDTSTGSKETLVVVFDSDRVVSLRVGYRGREIKL